MKRKFGCRGFFSITLMLLASFAQAQEKPNVVFIFADDAVWKVQNQVINDK